MATNSTSSDNYVHSPVVESPTSTAPPPIPEAEADGSKFRMHDITRDKSMAEDAAAPTVTFPGAQIKPRPDRSNDEDTTSGSEAYIGEAALATGGLAAATIYSNRDATSENAPKSNLHISTDEDEPAHPLFSSPMYPDAVPLSAASLRRIPSADRNDNSPAVSHTQRLSLSQGTGKGHYTTNTTLKELLQIPGPYDRIRACGDVQNKIIAADTGLDEWLTAVKSENPDYADIDGNYGGSVPFVVSSTRSKFSKALSPNSNTLQQPYYQQYLNASSPTSPQPPTQRSTTNSGGYAPPGSQHGGLSGFSGGGTKITTQQVQAKSKELLHTAGVFGGKGMKAGKGLLAKGKSRFASRGGGGPGGADKVD